MRTEETIRAEIAKLEKAIIEEEGELDWMPWDVAHNVHLRQPLAAALLALEWALGEERWRKAKKVKVEVKVEPDTPTP